MIAAAAVQKPKALRRGSRFAVIAPASPANSDRIAAGQKELERLGFSVALPAKFHPDGYFAAAADERRSEFLNALHDSSNADALIATRGGYGSVYLLDGELICHEKQVRDEKPACDKEPGRDEELACNEKLTRDEKLICHPERSEGSAFSLSQTLPTIKPLVGFSDITTLQIYLWQTHRWISIYGPMLAAGLDHGPGAPGGYDETSFRN